MIGRCGQSALQVQLDEPVWRPLVKVVGERLAGAFMWMHEDELEDGSSLHAYKHIHTRHRLRVMSGDRASDTLLRPMLSAETQVHRLSYEDVLRMVEVGVLREEDRVELVDGVLLDMSPPGAAHSAMVAWLTRHFAANAGHREVRVQDLLLVEGGFVMPDLMLLERPPRDRHPRTALLVVEVAVTTQRHDAAKARRYAGSRVGEYWIVDAAARQVRVHQRPMADGYELVAAHRDGDRIRSPGGIPAVEVGGLLASGGIAPGGPGHG